MKVRLDVVTNINLELTEEEAKWLKAVVQNPLHGQQAGEEISEDTDMRARFFNALGVI